jgi:hypothetical protein
MMWPDHYNNNQIEKSGLQSVNLQSNDIKICNKHDFLLLNDAHSHVLVNDAHSFIVKTNYHRFLLCSV